MGQVAVIKMDKSSAGKMEVADALVETPYSEGLIHDAVVYQRSKARQGTHAVKTRSMVQGATRKLYRQKGTGNARAGDRKAPQRRGGGIAHGPKVRSHAIGMNAKVRKLALRTAIAEKLREGNMIVLDALTLADHKTKPFAAWVAGFESPKTLIVTDALHKNLSLASRNVKDLEVMHFSRLNVYHLLAFNKALVTRGALKALEERLTG
ncbi:MAG TPA: 50S ribosomal protein L4 [bacterium]